MFWVALYLFHPGARRIMRWMIILFLLFSAFAFLGYSRRARADVPVIDIANQLSQAKSLLQDLKSYGTQLEQYANEVRQYEQWVYIGQQLIHDPSLGTFTQLANRLGLDTSVPLNPYAVQGLIAGAGGMRGLNGIMNKIPMLGSLVNTSFTNNQLYNCQTGDPGCQLSQ